MRSPSPLFKVNDRVKFFTHNQLEENIGVIISIHMSPRTGSWHYMIKDDMGKVASNVMERNIKGDKA